MAALWQLLLHFGWYVLIVLALQLLERRWPAGPQASRQEQMYDFALAAVAAITTTLVFDLGGLSNAIRSSLGIGEPIIAWQPRALWEWIAGSLAYLLLWDLLQYWFHRVQHGVPGLWRTHALHHDTEHLNAAAALRNTLWHHFGTAVLITLPLMAIMGKAAIHPYVAWLFFQTWGFYNHANLRLSHGPLTMVLSGPQLHRLHHGKAREYYNCNYAAIFPLIDVVFGTYKAPARNEFPETGLLNEYPSIGGARHMLGALLGKGEPRNPLDPLGAGTVPPADLPLAGASAVAPDTGVER